MSLTLIIIQGTLKFITPQNFPGLLIRNCIPNSESFRVLNRDIKAIDHPAWPMQPISYAECLLLRHLQGSQQGVQIFIFQRKESILIIVLRDIRNKSYFLSVLSPPTQSLLP